MFYTDKTITDVIETLTANNIEIQAWDSDNKDTLLKGQIVFQKDHVLTQLNSFGNPDKLVITLVRFKENEYGRSYNAPIDTVRIVRRENGQVGVEHIQYDDNKGTQRGMMKMFNRQDMTKRILNK